MVQALLQAAARVLEERGYAAATTEQEIAAIAAAVRIADLDLDTPLHDSVERIVKLAMAAMRHGPDFLRSLQQVPGAVFQRHLASARQSIIELVRQLLEARRHELQVTDLELAAFIAVSAAEGIGANVSADRFDDRLADEVTTLLTLYLTGENVRCL
jgi:hypothetical protein